MTLLVIIIRIFRPDSLESIITLVVIFFKFKMKVPKGNEMKRYVILFCVVLVFIVLSTVLAGYVSTMNIPNEVDQKFKKMPEWELLKSLPSNLTEMKTAFKLGNFAYRS